MKRRLFLANITGVAAHTPFIGNIIRANNQEIEKYGKPDLTLVPDVSVTKKRYKLVSNCYICIDNFEGVANKNKNMIVIDANAYLCLSEEQRKETIILAPELIGSRFCKSYFEESNHV